MKKEYRIRTFLWIAVILWMAVIFAFSAQDSDASSDTSDPLVDSVMEGFFGSGHGLSEFDIERLRSVLTFLVRKSGHFIEYAILGVLLCCAVSRYRIGIIKSAAISFSASSLYGVTDEIHQLFVSGRACRLFDVFVDSAGSLAGVTAATVILWIYLKKHNKVNKFPENI